MQTDAFANEFRGQPPAFDRLTERIDHRDSPKAVARPKLQHRGKQRQQQSQRESQVGDEHEKTGQQAQRPPELETCDPKAHGIEEGQSNRQQKNPMEPTADRQRPLRAIAEERDRGYGRAADASP